jgi:hypothetical protein
MDETDDLPRRQAASQYNHAEDARQIYRFSSGEANVRYGSLTDIVAAMELVRFVPQADITAKYIIASSGNLTPRPSCWHDVREFVVP